MRKVFCSIFILAVVFVKAQAPRNFYTTFGGSGDDIAYSVKVTLDGNYIVAGSTSSFGMGSTDVYLVKLDSMGNTMWSKTYGGIMSEVGRSVIQIPDSGYVVAGYGNSFGSGGYDVYILRTDKNGNMLWQQSFGGSDWDFANDLVLGSDGNIYVVGYTFSFGGGKKDGFVLKYDLAGQLLQQKFIGGSENEELNAIMKAADNSLVTVGYTESLGDINGDAYFLKMDLNLDTIYTKTFGGPYKDYASDVMQKASGDFMICGAKTFTLGGNTHSYFYRMTNGGTFVLDGSDFRNGGDEYFVSTANSKQSESFTAFVRTCSFPNIPGIKKQVDIFVSYPGGSAYIVNSKGGSSDEYAYSIESTSDGGYIIAGISESYGALGRDAYIIKVDSTILNDTSIVGLREQPKDEIQVTYFQDKISIAFEGSALHTVEIFDISGSLIYRRQEQVSEHKIDLANFARSIYLLRISDVDGRYLVKRFRR